MTDLITPDMFTRTNNDVNGNPRYILHFLPMLTEHECDSHVRSTLDAHATACARASIVGGVPYRGRDYGGGIVFQSYSLQRTCDHLNRVVEQAAELQRAGALAWIMDNKGARVGALIERDGRYLGQMYASARLRAGTLLVTRGGAPYASEGAAKAGIRRAGYRIA